MKSLSKLEAAIAGGWVVGMTILVGWFLIDGYQTIAPLMLMPTLPLSIAKLSLWPLWAKGTFIVLAIYGFAGTILGLLLSSCKTS
ncbi:hypothetical protein FY034_18885 (plasmid) [Trichlorobacter lovleyi]|uniref:hypothetical protein n=1 Tax=Trichlorobacter lovleyi TaxID=313985 RepID=UPI0022401146|nr:hypothetical protein [Trichlorobacter lovleyi]QOX81044.1 hypothetical protein FY034_18885 [Trichlorobacter lovleyi]